MPGKLGHLPGKLALLLGAAGGSGLLALWAQNGSLPLLATPAARAPAGLVAASGDPEASFTFQPEAGQRYIYSFERKISFESEPGTPAFQDIRYSGEFYIDVLRADSRSFEALLSERIKEAGGKPSAPLRVEVSSRGDELQLFGAQGAGSEEAQHISVLKDLTSLWLFPLRSDTVGSYDARFERVPGQPGFEQKVKIAYRSGGAAPPEILSSLHLLRWDYSLHLPFEVSGKEATRLGPGFLAHSHYELQFRSREKSPGFARELLAALNEREELQLNTRTASLAEHPEFSSLNWGSLLSQLKRIHELSGGEQLALFGDLLRYARLHPEKIGELAGLLRDPTLLRLGIDSPAFKTIVGALATLATAEALTALRQAYEDPSLPATGKGSILAALTTTQASLDAATREFLAQKLLSEKDPRLSDAAGFALGSSLQAAPNDEQAGRSVQLLEERWRAANEGGRLADQLAILDMIGNSGRAEFLPELQEVIASESDANVRARAVFALRFIPGSVGSTELITRLADPEPLVREAAAGAIDLAPWNEAFRPPLEACSSGEAEGRIQDSCRKVLAKNTRVANSR